MREIKFRGKSFVTGEWVYGDYHKRAEGVHCIIKMEPDKNGKVVYFVHQAVPDTIGQFTGLHDNNGKEIYEGDVLFVREWKNIAMGMFDRVEREQLSLEDCKGELLHESQRVVYFEEGSMCAGDYYISTLWDKQDKRHQYPIFEVEVIGNIHDNPNFLSDDND